LSVLEVSRGRLPRDRSSFVVINFYLFPPFIIETHVNGRVLKNRG
jgi:hypothetical protein